MNPRITSIENLIATDPGGRNVFGLVMTDQLRLAAQSLRHAKRVGIVSGFFIPDAGVGETDGPPGAKVLGLALQAMGIAVDYITDELNAPLFRALSLDPIVDSTDYLDRFRPTHLVSIERLGRGADGRYRNMRGLDITNVTAPLDNLFLEASRIGLTTIGIGDGGNEIGMGKVFADAGKAIEGTEIIATTIATDFCIAAGISNWGAYGLAGALSVLEGRDLLAPVEDVARDLERIVTEGGAVDGVTHRHETTIDGIDLSASLRMLESVRRQLAGSPFEGASSLMVGILGFGETGQAAAKLLARAGHQVRISDQSTVTLQPGMSAAGVESGGHTIDFLSSCDVVVASPGVPADSAILGEIHRLGIPVMSEMELAFQLGPPVEPTGSPTEPSLIAVTGTVGKRTTVELIQRLFAAADRSIIIGGNRGVPLSELMLNHHASEPLAVAVSSFQLETVVGFRPHVSILLNIDEAHLDRHRSIAEYVRIKSRIFMNHRPDDALILPFDDPRVRTLARKHHGRTFFVSSRQAVDRGAWLIDGVIRVNLDGQTETIGQAEPLFPENLLSAVIAARLYGVPAEQIAQAVACEAACGENV